MVNDVDRICEVVTGKTQTASCPVHPVCLNIVFDASVQQIFPALAQGGRVAVMPARFMGSPKDMAAYFQSTIAKSLVEKTMLAAEHLGYRTIGLAGGVSANSGVRGLLQAECDKRGYKLYMPELKYCGDNGAMVAAAGYFEYLKGNFAGTALNASALDDPEAAL